MKRTILFTALVAFIAFSSQAQKSSVTTPVAAPAAVTLQNAPADNPNAPKFEFEEETHNFGELNEGDPAVTNFVFKNMGKEPLIIKNARASCGCTVPSWPREPILPGDEGTIKVSYNTKGRPGGINKTITITSNASTPSKVLRITGKVVKAPVTPSSPEKKPNMLQTPKQ